MAFPHLNKASKTLHQSANVHSLKFSKMVTYTINTSGTVAADEISSKIMPEVMLQLLLSLLSFFKFVRWLPDEQWSSSDSNLSSSKRTQVWSQLLANVFLSSGIMRLVKMDPDTIDYRFTCRHLWANQCYSEVWE